MGHTVSDFERNSLHQETLRTQGQLHTCKRRDAMGRADIDAAFERIEQTHPQNGQLDENTV